MKAGQDFAGNTSITDRRVRPERRRKRAPGNEAITIGREDGVKLGAMTVELSENGVFAMTNDSLRVGEVVELEPLGGGQVSAHVRYKLGQLYGFEFVETNSEQLRRVRDICSKCDVGRSRRCNHDPKE